MNNVAYVKAILDSFSVQELCEMNAGAIDVIFKSQSYEGALLDVVRQQTGNEIDICVGTSDRISVLARISLV